METQQPASPSSTPILTIAIPTYKRAAELTQLLTLLQPQLRDRPEVDLYISDNASPDDTPTVVQQFLDSGMRIRYHRHPENIDSGPNFVSCFHAARGKYFWLFSDDDLILPGSLDQLLHHLQEPGKPPAELDILYLTGYGFRDDYLAEREGDPLHRRFHTLTDPLHVARVINIMFTFISGIVINRDRLLDLPHVTGLTVEDPSAFMYTNLPQLSWSLPLLRAHRRSRVLWNRPIAGRTGNGGGYAVGHVFGEKLVEFTSRLLPDRPDLARAITDYAVRRWFPTALYEIRSSGNPNLGLNEAGATLKQVYGKNLRFWLFVYPVLELPLPLAHLWVKAGAIISKLAYMVRVPSFWRKQF